MESTGPGWYFETHAPTLKSESNTGNPHRLWAPKSEPWQHLQAVSWKHCRLRKRATAGLCCVRCTSDRDRSSLSPRGLMEWGPERGSAVSWMMIWTNVCFSMRLFSTVMCIYPRCFKWSTWFSFSKYKWQLEGYNPIYEEKSQRRNLQNLEIRSKMTPEYESGLGHLLAGWPGVGRRPFRTQIPPASMNSSLWYSSGMIPRSQF